jgi:crotonobetainyl-CoA:carnitine CoA-transferase CaiB-like acyl-CoA transferase
MSTARGPLHGIRVVELASEQGAFAGLTLAGMGADVIVVEPPGGHGTRTYEPFVDDRPDPEQSLWWWHYNVGKRGVVLDLDGAEDAESFRRLVATADVVIEGERPGRLTALGVDYADVASSAPGVVWVSATPFGREGPRRDEPATDLTLLAGGGPAWSCGYDDHSLPPVRGGGNQAFHLGSVHAVMAVLTALLEREDSGRGQLIDLSLHAAANVTCEAASYTWLVAQQTVQRQTGRHAAQRLTMPTQVQAADGLYLNTGVQPRTAHEFEMLIEWLSDLGLRDDFPDIALLELAVEHGGANHADIERDPLVTELARAGREALLYIAERVPAYDVFKGAQDHGLPCGIVYSPDEAFTDRHMVARGMGVDVLHEDLDRTVRYVAPPLMFKGAERVIPRRPPHVGEHDHEILEPLRDSSRDSVRKA